MVLSNKKLKQKLRVARAELLLASGEVHPSKSQLASDSLLDSAALKKSFSKREKRRINRPLEVLDDVNSKGAVDAEEGNRELDEQTGLKEKKKSTKRKRSGEGSENNPEGENDSNSYKKKKKQKKKKKNKKNTGLNKTAEAVVKERDVNMAEASVEQDTDKREEIVEVPTKVYAGGIPYYSTEDDIRSYFESCGTIAEIDCMTFPESGKFRGIAILTFKTEAAARRALALDGSDMGGLFLKISPFKSTAKVKKTYDSAPKMVEGYNRIYAGNLSWEITEDDIKKHFSNCTITSIRFGVDKETGEFKGYAHIDFSDSQSLRNALKLDQTVVCGRPIKISCAVPLRNPQDLNSTKTEEPLAVAKSNDNTTETYVPKITTETTSTTTEEAVAVSGKIRRRTCYECGGKGHLSSMCPNKQAVEPNSTEMEEAETGDNTTTETCVPKYTAENTNTTTTEETVAVSGKIKRRTCYECGGKGHLSSMCPNKQAVESNTAKIEEPLPTAKSGVNTTIETYVPKTTSETNTTTTMETVAVRGKIRRRTCYECGEKGHLSSACPNKQGVNPITAV